MASVAIELKNIGMKFGDETILENVNLSIEQGETLVIVGPSGQGKSVLLKIMAGVIIPTEGKVFIEGHDLLTLGESERQKISQKMGMLFQKNALFDSLTVGENVAFPMRETTKFDEQKIQETVRRFLDAVGILHAKDLFPDEISGGMQKRLGIARAIALAPEIIFYDDPTAGLDPITSRKIVDLICELQEKQNSTVVAITNDMNRAYQMADKIVMVVDHQCISTGNEQQTKDHQDPRVFQFIRGRLAGPLTSIG